MRTWGMKVSDRFCRSFRVLAAACVLVLQGWGTECVALDLGTPPLSVPLQTEKFFDTNRLVIKGGQTGTPGVLEPEAGFSYAAREDETRSAEKQTTQRVHGEAGGKLNLMDNLSLTALARIPLYTRETRYGEFDAQTDGKSSSELLRNTGNLSWRSEMGVKLGSGVDLNLFYDKSMSGRMEKPGVDDREEKFGTRFIIHFK